MKALINGVELRYEIDGPLGAPWLTFANSLLTDLRIWDAQAQALAGEFRVLRYDHRGHGQSGASSGDYSIDLLASDLLALLMRLDITRTHVVGVSIGGTTAAYAVHRAPAWFTTLTLVDCQPRGQGAGVWTNRARLAQAEGLDALVDESLARWFAPSFLVTDQERAENLRAMMLSTSVDGYVGCAAALEGFDSESRLRQLQLPKLMLAGSLDGPAPHALAGLSTRVPNARFVEIPDAGHLSPVDGADRVSAELLSFVRANEVGRKES